MMPRLRETIGRQSTKISNMIEATDENGYPALLPPAER